MNNTAYHTSPLVIVTMNNTAYHTPEPVIADTNNTVYHASPPVEEPLVSQSTVLETVSSRFSDMRTSFYTQYSSPSSNNKVTSAIRQLFQLIIALVQLFFTLCLRLCIIATPFKRQPSISQPSSLEAVSFQILDVRMSLYKQPSSTSSKNKITSALRQLSQLTIAPIQLFFALCLKLGIVATPVKRQPSTSQPTIGETVTPTISETVSPIISETASPTISEHSVFTSTVPSYMRSTKNSRQRQVSEGVIRRPRASTTSSYNSSTSGNSVSTTESNYARTTASREAKRASRESTSSKSSKSCTCERCDRRHGRA